MSTDFYLESYDFILREVTKWKAVPLTLLYTLSGYSGTRTSFCRVIRNLESKNLVKAGHVRGKEKIIYATDELALIKKSKGVIFNEESLSHEAIVTRVGCRLLNWNIFNEITLPHEVLNKRFDEGIRRLPDAMLDGTFKKRDFKLALEIELTRKSKKRVENKIDDYLNNNVFDYVLYLFNERSNFEAYKRMLTNYLSEKDKVKKNQAENRFILGFGSKLVTSNCELQNLEIYYQGKNTNLESIFGRVG